MAKAPQPKKRDNPVIAWIVIAVLLALVVGLFATYLVRPGRSPADDSRTTAAINNMDTAQDVANEKRDEKRGADGLLN